MTELQPGLLAFLSLQATIHSRDPDGTMAVMREAALALDDREAMAVIHLVERTIPGADRLWLSRISGR